MVLSSWAPLLILPALAISSIPILILFWDYPGKGVGNVLRYIAAFAIVFAIILPLSLYLFGIWTAIVSPLALLAYVLIARTRRKS